MARRPRGTRVISIEGLGELLSKTRPELYRADGKAALKQIADAGAQAARAGAPKMSGRLRGSIVPKINSSPKPIWAAVKVGALSPRGYPYPRLLEFSPKHRHRDWLKKAVERARGAFASAVNRAAGAIERKWAG